MPHYTDLVKALEKTKSSFHPAQVHGLICGLICAVPEDVDYDWKTQILGEKPDRTSLAVLTEIYENSYHQLNEFSFEFTLLLPEDEVNIVVRTESLGLWCQGFLIGLQQSEKVEHHDTSEELESALQDIVEVAKVDYTAVSQEEEDESSYFELVEYVRLAVVMIYTELKTDTLHDSTQSLLH